MAELRDPAELRRALAKADRTCAWLGRQAGRSRQFISMLANGVKSITTDEVARAIEEALSVDSGSLFVLTDLAAGKVGTSSQVSHRDRNPQQIRERNAAEHERAKQDLERARATRDALTYAGRASEMQIRVAEEALIRADRLFRYWDRLMREAAS